MWGSEYLENIFAFTFLGDPALLRESALVSNNFLEFFFAILLLFELLII